MKKEISAYGINAIDKPLASECESTSNEPQTIDATAQQNDADEYLYLIGQPTLKQFIHFVRDRAVKPEGSGDLTEEWQAANTVVRVLEKDEAGIADNPTIEPISPDNELLLEFLKNPLVRNSFNTVPTEVAYVNLNEMVVYQHHIDLTFVRQLENRLKPSMSKEDIFRFCLPNERSLPPAKWSRLHKDTYVFVSPSNDLRFLGVMPLEGKHVQGYPHPGNLVGLVGLAVGFGSNFLNAIYAEGLPAGRRWTVRGLVALATLLVVLGIFAVFANRQVLNADNWANTSSDMLANSAIRTAVTNTPNFFLKEPRPMMLKDYFNPRLRKILPVHRRTRKVTGKFEIDDGFVTAL